MARFNYANYLAGQMENVLKVYGERVADAAKEALADNAEELCQTVKSKCPVRTGRLLNSIHVSRLKDGAVYKVIADAQGDDGTPYARIVEFSPKIDKPFMYPSMDEKRDKFKRNVVSKIKEAIRHE